MRVLIVDDHALVRAGIVRLLQGQAGIDAVAEAQDARQALEQAVTFRPDIVLLDLSLAGQSGLDAIAPLRKLLPQVRIVIMSMHDDQAHVRDAMERGCSGFIVKDAAPVELELALRAAAAGQVFLSPQVSAKMLARLAQTPAHHRHCRTAAAPARDPARLGRGLSSKEIAAALGISVKTVETHRARMMETLGCRRANELLLLAARHLAELD
jgi:DNA-binding NarL/FixJ family response regulator